MRESGRWIKVWEEGRRWGYKIGFKRELYLKGKKGDENGYGFYCCHGYPQHIICFILLYCYLILKVGLVGQIIFLSICSTLSFRFPLCLHLREGLSPFFPFPSRLLSVVIQCLWTWSVHAWMCVFKNTFFCSSSASVSGRICMSGGSVFAVILFFLQC